MARIKTRTLRGSVMQNNPRRVEDESHWFGFGLRLGLLAGSACLLLLLSAWLWHIGWPQRQADRLIDGALQMTQRAHFSVRDVVVEGRRHTDKKELFAALGVGANAPILGFDPAAAHEKVLELPWVANAVIERRLPDTVYVRLTERQPLARWQHDNKVSVIDREGHELPAAKPEQFAQLPLVVGHDAPAQAEDLLTTLKNFPEIERIMKAAVRVSERRWNLYLQPKLLVRLPEDNMSSALAHLVRLIHEQKILERDLAAVDLRLPDRLVFEPNGAAPAKPTGESN